MRAVSILLVLGLAACGRLGFDPTIATTGDASEDVLGIDAPACATGPVVESVNTGILQIGNPGTDNTQPLSVPLDRTILFVTIRQAEPSPAYGATLCELIAAGVHCQRWTQGSPYPQSVGIIIRWTTVTFSSGVTVQRGRLTSTASTTAPLTMIDPLSSFVLLTGATANVGASWGSNEFMRARIASPQAVEIVPMGAAEVIAWQVVSMEGAKVINGTTAIPAGQLDRMATFPAVDLGSSFVLESHNLQTSAVGANWTMTTADLTDASTVRIRRATSDNGLDAAWSVITVPFQVVRGATSMGIGQSTQLASATLSPSAVAFGTGQSLLGPSSGSTDLPGSAVDDDLIGEASATFTTMGTGVEIQRASTLANATFTWAAVDFAKPLCP